jgi:hypothetical protein
MGAVGREAKSSASPSPRRPARRNHQQQTPTSRQPPRDPMRKRGRASSRPPAREATPTLAAGRRAPVRGPRLPCLGWVCPSGVREGRSWWAEWAVAPLLPALLKYSVREARVCLSVRAFFFLAWQKKFA